MHFAENPSPQFAICPSSEMSQSDPDEYFRFTGKQRLEKAISTLHGMLQGIIANGVVLPIEIDHLRDWLREHRQVSHLHPFSEVYPLLTTALADGKLDEEEVADLTWLTERLNSDNRYWDDVTADMQELHGFLRGVIADGRIDTAELAQLSAWVDARSHLRRCWPYDELESIIAMVMNDGVIDDQEHEALLQFFGEFSYSPERKSIGAIDRETTVSGVCAYNPTITFLDHLYCFTGASERGDRNYLASTVATLGGRFNKGLRNDTSYLVVGAAGNPCWAYACYGRKVEDAIARRRAGQKLLIVHEYDFWDAVEDAGI
jgi:hypothetical protein